MELMYNGESIGTQGKTGKGVLVSGSTGHIPAKESNKDYDIAWVDTQQVSRETLNKAPNKKVNEKQERILGEERNKEDKLH